MGEERVIPVNQTTDLVTFTIKSDGTVVSSEYQVVSVTVIKDVNKIPQAELIFLDGDAAQEDFPLSNKEDFIPGKEIEISAGYHSDEKVIFKGIIVSHAIKVKKNRASFLSVECRDKAVKMTAARNNKYFYESTDSDIIEEIIGTYGLASDIESTEVQHKEMVQYYCTDWDFIASRAEANGKLIFVDDGKITVKKPDTSTEPVLSLIYGSTMMEFEAEMDARSQLAAVKSKSWDYSSQEIIEEESEDPSVEETGNISASDLTDVLGISEFAQIHSGKIEDQELKAWADAKALKAKLAKIRGRVKCQGYAEVKPGSMIELKGVGDRFNGKAFVSGVCHQINHGNWETDIQFGLNPKWFSNTENINDAKASGLVPAVNGLHAGIVTQLESDPDGEDRILVKMPSISLDDEGIWARIATLDAGENRGSFFRPEIGDEVLLGFLNDDPRDPVVLGMMNSSAKPAPLTASDSNPEKGFVTRSELKLIFNDEKKTIQVETPNGNKITLSDDEGSITLEDESGNKITMSADGISLESAKDVIIKATGDVKVEGVNAEIKASAQFKAEGSAGAEVKSSATAVLKGSLVQIN